MEKSGSPKREEPTISAVRALCLDRRREEARDGFLFLNLLNELCDEVHIAVGRRGLLEVQEIRKKKGRPLFDLLLILGDPEAMEKGLAEYREYAVAAPHARVLCMGEADEEGYLRLRKAGMDEFLPSNQPLWLMEQALERNVDRVRMEKEARRYKEAFANAQKKLAQVGMRYRRDMLRYEKQAETREAWFASMVHELRTPLNGIVGLSQLLGDEPLPPAARETLGRLQNSAEILRGLVNDLLDFSKLEAGKLEVERIEFDINEVLDRVADIVRVPAEEKRLALVFQIGKGVPARIQGDPLRLGQVLINLMNNAVKFTKEGEITLKIDLREGSREELVFQVIDTGVGMSLEQQKKLFRPFSQAEASTSRQYGGTGLGLSIAKELVERMGGIIGVRSTPGKGSRFYFTLPLEKRERRSYRLPSKDMMGKQVLLADEHTPSAKALAGMLEYFRFRVTVVQTPEEVAERLRLGNYDILFATSKMLEERYGALGATRLVWLRKRLSGEELPEFYRQILDATLETPYTQRKVFETILELFSAQEMRRAEASSESLLERLKRRKGITVMVAEDSSVNQAVMLGLLERAGVRAVMVENGREVLETLPREPGVSLIFLDMQMPVMDGRECALKLREHPRWSAIPVVAMSGERLAAEELERLGISGAIEKPVDVEKLYQTVLQFAGGQEGDAAAAVEEIQALSIPGVDWKRGLRRAGENRELYLRLLANFVEEYRPFPRKGQEMIARHEFLEAQRYFGLLQEAAKNLCLTEIERSVLRLINALKEWEVKASVSLCNQLEEEIENLGDSLEVIFPEEEPGHRPPRPGSWEEPREKPFAW